VDVIIGWKPPMLDESREARIEKVACSPILPDVGYAIHNRTL